MNKNKHYIVINHMLEEKKKTATETTALTALEKKFLVVWHDGQPLTGSPSENFSERKPCRSQSPAGSCRKNYQRAFGQLTGF